MASAVKVVTVKSFLYRGAPEEWSNAYHFTGDSPSDEAHAKILLDEVRDRETLLWPSSVVFVRGYVYDVDAVHATYVFDEEHTDEGTTAGVFDDSGLVLAPGDAAMQVRWWDGTLNSRGRKIYLRKYFHGVCFNEGDEDFVAESQLAELQNFGDHMIDGSLPAGRRICDEEGDQGVVALAGRFITTRTLKRRGRRPPPP